MKTQKKDHSSPVIPQLRTETPSQAKSGGDPDPGPDTGTKGDKKISPLPEGS
ncbi:MAG TPA: hypothetical protein VF179_15120 [Thermoanaerobaculia bacterium]|nr:hypothetical protein [Thermoanaerobaculia bacterium]